MRIGNIRAPPTRGRRPIGGLTTPQPPRQADFHPVQTFRGESARTMGRRQGRIRSPRRTSSLPTSHTTVLAPLAVDQAAVRSSCGHQRVGSSARLIANGNVMTVTKRRTERPRPVKMSLMASGVLTRPACIAGVRVARPKRNALCGRTKLSWQRTSSTWLQRLVCATGVAGRAPTHVCRALPNREVEALDEGCVQGL